MHHSFGVLISSGYCALRRIYARAAWFGIAIAGCLAASPALPPSWTGLEHWKEYTTTSNPSCPSASIDCHLSAEKFFIGSTHPVLHGNVHSDYA